MRAVVIPLLMFPMAHVFGLKPRFAWDPAVLDAMNENTRRAYVGAMKRLEDWLDGRRLTDASLALYIQYLEEAGRGVATVEQALSAVRNYARAHGLPDPVGRRTVAALRKARRASHDRPRGQTPAATPEEVRALVNPDAETAAYAEGRRKSTGQANTGCPTLGALIALLYMGALRVSEAAALRWDDVRETDGGRGVHVWVRRSKGNPYGACSDVRYLTGACAKALLRWRAVSKTGDNGSGRAVSRRAANARSGDRKFGNAAGRVFGGVTAGTLSRRVGEAVKAAGLARRLTPHSFRVGLAAELTRRGASVQEVMLAGGWKSPAMVAHYSAAARAEGGAVAKYL